MVLHLNDGTHSVLQTVDLQIPNSTAFIYFEGSHFFKNSIFLREYVEFVFIIKIPWITILNLQKNL